MSKHPDRDLVKCFENPVDWAIGRVFPGWQRRRVESRLRVAAAYRVTKESRKRRSSVPDVGGDAEKHLDPDDLWNMREQSRAGERDNCIISGTLDRKVDNIVATGIRPEAQTKDDKWNAAAEAAYAEDFEVTGRFDDWELQALAQRAIDRDGDFGVILRNDGKLQAVEAHQIGTPTDLISKTSSIGTKLTNGIEAKKDGTPVAYWIGKPLGDAGCYLENSAHCERVEARNFIHLVAPKRTTQTRGVPMFHAALALLDMMDEYIDVEMVGNKTSAMLTAFVSQRGADLAAYARSVRDTDDDGNALYEEKLRSGAIMYGEPGEGVDVIGGNRPNRNFPPFIRSMLVFLSINTGIPLQVITLDFSDTNYSSFKAALLQAQVPWKRAQKYLIRKLVRRTWSWKIGRLIHLHKMPQIDNALSPKILAPGWRWADILQQLKASEGAVAAGLSTLQREAAELGEDWKDLMSQRAVEIALAKEKADELSKTGGAVDWRELTVSRPVSSAPVTA